MQQSHPESDGPGEARSLEQEIELLGLGRRETELLRKMAREAEQRLGSSRSLPASVRARRYRPPNRVPIAGVPRNFNAGRMLVIVTLYAVLFSLLQLTNAPAVLYPLIGIFCAAILLGQMLLFGGRQPRLASCIVGALALPLLSFVSLLMTMGPRQIGALPCFAVLFSLVGMIAGYLVGTLCAGAFLIMDRKWNAGQIVDEKPVDAAIVDENGIPQGHPISDGPVEEDPWSNG